MFAAIVSMSLFVISAPLEEPKDKELPEAARKELKKLEGNWNFVKGVSSKGEGMAEGKLRDFILEFKGNRMCFQLGDETKETLQIAAIDPGTDPKCIDLQEKGSRQAGSDFGRRLQDRRR